MVGGVEAQDGAGQVASVPAHLELNAWVLPVRSEQHLEVVHQAWIAHENLQETVGDLEEACYVLSEVGVNLHRDYSLKEVVQTIDLVKDLMLQSANQILEVPEVAALAAVCLV